MKIRRLAAFAGVSIYAAILATSPTVFIPLEYAVHPQTGEQILFQDAACTVPVTTIGQQIGGVKWNGVIVAVQTVDARRPQWLGVGIGAWFDGVDDWLSLSDDWKRNPGVASTWVYRESHPSDRNQVIGGWSSAINTDVAYAWYYRTDNGLIQRVGTGSTLLVTGVIPHDQINTVSFRNDTSNYTARVNGSDIQTRATGDQNGDIEVPASLGSLAGSTQFFEGSVAWAALYDRSAAVSTLEILEAS